MPAEAQPGQEGARLGEAAAEAGQLLDAVGGLGDGTNRGGREGLADDLGVVGQCARREVPVASPESVQPAVAIGQDVPLGGGEADVGQVGGLLAGVAEVDGPQDEHLAADDRVRVGVTVGQDGRSLGGGQSGAEPGGHP